MGKRAVTTQKSLVRLELFWLKCLKIHQKVSGHLKNASVSAKKFLMYFLAENSKYIGFQPNLYKKISDVFFG
jgi:hypothetical protein